MRDGGCERAAVPAPPLPGRCDPAASPSLLRPGCHLLEFARQGEPAYLDGTLRVEATADGMVASGDLYARPQADPAVGGSVEPPDPAAGIPIFPVADYLCYLRVTGIDQSAEGVTLTIEEHRFHEPGIEFLDGTRQWFVGSTFTVPLAPDGPALTGTFVDSLSTVILAGHRPMGGALPAPGDAGDRPGSPVRVAGHQRHRDDHGHRLRRDRLGPHRDPQPRRRHRDDR